MGHPSECVLFAPLRLRLHERILYIRIGIGFELTNGAKYKKNITFSHPASVHPTSEYMRLHEQIVIRAVNCSILTVRDSGSYSYRYISQRNKPRNKQRHFYIYPSHMSRLVLWPNPRMFNEIT